jgi:hypothetical protein
LRRANNQSLRVESAVSDHPAVTATAEGTGPVVTLRIAVAASAVEAGEAAVRVRLADPPGREVVVPVGWGRR